MRYRHIDTFVQKAGPCSTEGVLVARTGRSPPSSSSSFTTQFFFCNRVRPVTLCVPSCASRKNLPIKQATGFRIKYGKLILSVSGRLNPFWDAIWRFWVGSNYWLVSLVGSRNQSTAFTWLEALKWAHEKIDTYIWYILNSRSVGLKGTRMTIKNTHFGDIRTHQQKQWSFL